MDIIISNAGGIPIYKQIYDGVRDAIITGALAEDDPLPSIRTLAKDLRISVITTKRAYDELERDGYIYTVAAKGCYVAAKDTQLVREQYLRRIEEHLQAAVALAAPLALDADELCNMLRLAAEEEEKQ